jgi:hypothetical protein
MDQATIRDVIKVGHELLFCFLDQKDMNQMTVQRLLIFSNMTTNYIFHLSLRSFH